MPMLNFVHIVVKRYERTYSTNSKSVWHNSNWYWYISYCQGFGMNERIKQFAELSKSYKTMIVDGQMQSVLQIDPERFAGMIIQECVDLIDTLNEAYDAPSTAGKFIKKHFGIE